MPLTLETVGSALLLNPLPDTLWSWRPISGLSLCLPGGGLYSSDSLHCRWVCSWQQNFCSVLMVFILFSLFACEESKLIKKQTENKKLRQIYYFLIFSWRNLMCNFSSKYLPQYENNEGQQQQTPYDATNQNPERDGNSSAFQHFQHSLRKRDEGRG